MELERVWSVSMGRVLVQVGRQVDDGYGLERAFLTNKAKTVVKNPRWP